MRQHSRDHIVIVNAVLFDCDGVLVDSETITLGVLRDMLEALGWAMTLDECMRRFVGKSLKAEMGLVSRKTGAPVPDTWLPEYQARRNAALQQHVQAIPHALDAVQELHARYNGRIACASGADRIKVELQLTKVGLITFFAGRIFSGYELQRSKPAPDIYLAAAAALGVDPRACAVIEDSITGVQAGVAAGCTVLGYCPGDQGLGSSSALRAAGANFIFNDMALLPGLLAAAKNQPFDQQAPGTATR